MVAAGTTLKFLYPKRFYLTCVAHLLHNCALKIKSDFEGVDQPIAKVILATIQTKPDKPNLLPLVAHFNLSLQDGNAAYIMQRIYLK